MNPDENPLWLFVVGARPQFVKLAAVMRAARAHARAFPGGLLLQTIHTGQHYDHGLSQVFFDEMEIPAPDLNLGVGSGHHGAMTAKMLKGLEREMLERHPALVVTFGDTNSTMAAALTAAKLNIPTAHIEAGLRSFNRRMPEEINRVVTDHISNLLFCPSEASAEQLRKEGIERGVHVVGDVMYDTFLHYRSRAIAPKIEGEFVLATLHRPDTVENAESLASVIQGISSCPLPVVLPAHPRTRRQLIEFDIEKTGKIRIVDPLSYFEMLGHLDACQFVITDSGGLQKEAFYAGKRCITTRSETEWTELVDIDANRIVNHDRDALIDAFDWALRPFDITAHPYGDGHACERIVDLLAAAAPARPIAAG